MVGVEVGEEIGDGEVASVAEGVDEEAGVRDESCGWYGGRDGRGRGGGGDGVGLGGRQ